MALIKKHYRNRISVVSNYLSILMMIVGGVLFVPLLVGVLYGEVIRNSGLVWAFAIPGLISIGVGIIIKNFSKPGTIFLKDAMLTCTLGWIVFTLAGAVPYVIILGSSYVDACFETMSGFTTTGITVLTGLDTMPKTLIFWRAFTQWIGGLGILSMFIVIGFKKGAAVNKLFMSESHKISAKKPAPGIINSAKVLWSLYILFTILQALILMLLQVDFFDALTHSLTTLSTGGYSMYDSSIAFYQLNGYKYYNLIELTYMVFMLVGGINFFLHFRMVKGDMKALWDNTEIRSLWMVLGGGILLMFASYGVKHDLLYYAHEGIVRTGIFALLYHVKDISFQAISILTTTGYGTRNINGLYFTAFAKQLFLVYMVIGGCAGSTSGGVKVIRIATLFKLVKNRLFKLNTSRRLRAPVTIDGSIVEQGEMNRITILFFMWIVLLVIGGGITAFFSELSAWSSFSGMFSALGNIGPCYISIAEMIQLGPVVKVTYILGMLAGRLELIPVLIIFGRKFFK